MSAHRFGVAGAIGLLLVPAVASATPDWVDMINFSGFVQSDVRFNIDNYRGPTPGQGYNFSMNRNDLDLRLEIKPQKRVVGVVEARLRYYGFVDSQTIAVANLWDASQVSPFTLFLDSAYVAVKNVPVSWMDIKAGRMIQTWGSADIFSPNDNINSRDFSDPLDFTHKVANEMIELDAYPTKWLTFNLVWVPVFQPAMLPPSAPLAFQVGENSQGCLTSFPAPPLTVAQNQQLEGLFGDVNPCQLNFAPPQVTTLMPGNSIGDSQVAFRARMKLGDLDLGLNYYYGRFGFPVAYDASVQVTPGAGGKQNIAYSAEVIYPRMQVAGLDFSYSSPYLADIGFVGEFAVIFPEEVDFALGVYENGSNLLTLNSVNVPRTPFIKGVFGADYTFTSWLYANVMYVRGFIDEFDDKYGLHDYITGTLDIKMAHDVLDLRTTAMFNLEDGSNVVYPQLNWIIMPGVEATAGAFVLGGSTHPSDPYDYAARSKFGQPATGRSVAFLRTKFTW